MIYIDSQAALEELCAVLEDEAEFAFDTEFIRENTFVPILCLMQVATQEEIYLIDCPRLDLTSFLKILSNQKITKVMHSASQDIDLFVKNYDLIPQPIFDAQIAASFLGYGSSISYAKLVRDVLKIRLNKASKLTNWLNRPLSKAQKNYAASDVKYLLEIKAKLSNKLTERERLTWLNEEFAKLYELSNYYVAPQDAWQRITQNSDTPFFLNYLQAYAAYREELAVQKNLPRRFIIKDEYLVGLAKLKPQTQDDLASDRILKKYIKPKYLESLLKLSQEVAKQEIELEAPQKSHLSDNNEMICDLLKIYLKYIAKKYKIAAANIAKSNDIKNFVLKSNDYSFAEGWRYEVFGQGAESILAGELVPTIKDGRLEF